MKRITLLTVDTWLTGETKTRVVMMPKGMAAYRMKGMRRPRGCLQESDLEPIQGSRKASIRRPDAAISPSRVMPAKRAPWVTKRVMPLLRILGLGW